MPHFTFYCLVKTNYAYELKPHINIYNNMLEIINWQNKIVE